MPTPSNVRDVAAQNRAAALELRRAGATYQQIAEKLGYANAGTVHRMIRQAIDAIPRESAEAYRSEELDRLDALQRGLWPKARQGEVRSVTALLKVMERRARLLGLDAPVRVQATVTSELDAQIEELVAQLTDTAESPA